MQFLQHLEITRRIEEAVGMIHAYAMEPLVGEQLTQQRVRCFEHFRTLDLQPRERVDVEESPVVDFV